MLTCRIVSLTSSVSDREGGAPVLLAPEQLDVVGGGADSEVRGDLAAALGAPTALSAPEVRGDFALALGPPAALPAPALLPGVAGAFGPPRHLEDLRERNGEGGGKWISVGKWWKEWKVWGNGGKSGKSVGKWWKEWTEWGKWWGKVWGGCTRVGELAGGVGRL